MANAQIVSNLVAKTMTEFFEQFSPIIKSANRDFQEEFTQQSYATGGSINIKVPGTPAVQRGLVTTATDIQDLVINYPIVPNDIYSVTRNLNLYEQKFNLLGGMAAMTKPVKRAIVDNLAYPAFQAIMGQMEITAALRMKLGAYLSPIDSIAALGGINTVSLINELQNFGDYIKLPAEGRTLMMNGYDYTAVANSLNNSFVTEISKPLLMTGRFASKQLSGFNVWKSVDMPTHIAGPSAEATGVTVTSLDASATTLTLAGLASTSGVLFVAGDRIAIPSVKIISPITNAVLNYGLVVTVAADANGDGAGNCAVTLSYPLMASGEHANVAALPVTGAAVEIFPSYNLNFAYSHSGLSSVMLPMADIEGAYNSDTIAENRAPVKVNVQGSVSSFSNIFRISALQACKVFPPYIIAFPSRAV